MSNNLKVKRLFKDTNTLKDLKKHELDVESDNDVVVQGLGFIKFTHKAKIVLYTKENVSVYVRKNLI